MTMNSFRSTQLEVRIYPDPARAGADGAALAADAIRAQLSRHTAAAVVLASAVSQDPFLAALRGQPGIDWRRVTVFHLDEYAGIAGDHPASFRRFLRERFLDYIPVAAFHELDGQAADLDAECARYTTLLRGAQPCLVALGIGENGHLAFIDPHACDFNDRRDVRPVDLDPVCREQQVHDGAFACADDVPRRALSLTVPFFLRVPQALVFVNGPAKSAAAKTALEGPIEESCPASALRRHRSATVFLDSAAAALLGN